MSMQVSKVWWDGEKLMAEPINAADVYKPEPVTEWLTCPKCNHKSPYSPIKAKTLAEDAERITRQARQALAEQPAQQQEPVVLDVTLDDEDALAALRDTIVQSNGDLTGIRLLVGNGHSGYGLYVANVEYQEEGAILLAHTSTPASKPLTEEQRTTLREAFAQALTSVYVCGRTWEAWQYGTMSEGDFQPASECEEVLDSLIEAAKGIEG